MGRQQYDYGQALDDLERMHRDGQISDSRYELHKAKLLGEATKPKRPASVTFLIWVGVAIAAYFLLRVLAMIVDNLPGNSIGCPGKWSRCRVLSGAGEAGHFAPTPDPVNLD